MTAEPRWLSIHTVLAIHAALLAEHGGALGEPNLPALEICLAAPRNHALYTSADLHVLAAVLGHALVRNRPFVDGNKRVALVATVVFLERNGLRFGASEADAATVTWALAGGELTVDDFAAWLRDHTEPE